MGESQKMLLADAIATSMRQNKEITKLKKALKFMGVLAGILFIVCLKGGRR